MRGSSTGGGEQINRQPGASQGHQNHDWRRGGRSSTTIFVTRGEERAREEQGRGGAD